jgi:hypothetical protein
MANDEHVATLKKGVAAWERVAAAEHSDPARPD